MNDYTTTRTTQEIENVSRVLAPEDICAGMYVAVLTERHTVWPEYFSLDDIAYDRIKPLVYNLIASKGGTPQHVVEVCLPFVLVETAQEQVQTLDVRVSTLAQVSERYGRELFRLTRQAKARKREEKKEQSTS